MIENVLAKEKESSPRTSKKKSFPNHNNIFQAAIFSHLGDGIIITDSSFKIFFINKRAQELLKLDPHTPFQEKTYSEYFKLHTREGQEIDPSRDPIRIASKEGKAVRATFMDDMFCTRADGSSFPISISASPIILDTTPEGIVVIFDDITEEKKIDEIKSDFIYIASHQLRTPLTVSTLHTEMLLAGHGGELTTEQRELLSEIHFYNKKMAQLLSVFMTVSKIELGTFVMQNKPTDLRLVIEDVLHELSTQIKSKKLKILLPHEESIGIIETDPEFIRIVFQNLLSNAVKYTPHEGTIKITIKKERENILITIEDTGCGIPLNEQSQVFTKLYRGSNTKNYRWDSNGLGLYITKAIIDKCKGRITFKSEENKGTTFYVYLPVTSISREK